MESSETATSSDAPITFALTPKKKYSNMVIPTEPVVSFLSEAPSTSEVGRRSRRQITARREYLSDRYEWTNEDKLTLVRGLRKYGLDDVENITKLFPQKTEQQVRGFIQQRIQMQRVLQHKRFQLKKVTRNPIEEWLSIVDQKNTKNYDHSQIVTDAVMYIAKYENHPDPACCNYINYGNIYKYFANLMSGMPPMDLNPNESRRVNKLFGTLAQTLRSEGMIEEKKFLRNCGTTKTDVPRVRQYGGKKRAATDAEETVPPGLQSLNIFDVPAKLLKCVVQQ